MITATVDLRGVLAKFAQVRSTEFGPGLRQVALMVEGFLRGRIDSGKDVRGASFAPRYPKPENVGKTPLKNTGATFRDSIKGTSTATEARIGTPWPPSRILTLGGQTRAHAIAPSAKRVLSWTNPGGSQSFRSIVQHPGSSFPRREVFALSPLEQFRVKTVFSEQLARTLRRAAGNA